MSEALFAKQQRILYQLTHNDSGKQRDIYFERTAQQGLRESISFLVLRQPFLPYMLESDATYKQATVVYQKLHHGKRYPKHHIKYKFLDNNVILKANGLNSWRGFEIAFFTVLKNQLFAYIFLSVTSLVQPDFICLRASMERTAITSALTKVLINTVEIQSLITYKRAGLLIETLFLILIKLYFSKR